MVGEQRADVMLERAENLSLNHCECRGFLLELLEERDLARELSDRADDAVLAMRGQQNQAQAAYQLDEARRRYREHRSIPERVGHDVPPAPPDPATANHVERQFPSMLVRYQRQHLRGPDHRGDARVVAGIPVGGLPSAHARVHKEADAIAREAAKR